MLISLVFLTAIASTNGSNLVIWERTNQQGPAVPLPSAKSVITWMEGWEGDYSMAAYGGAWELYTAQNYQGLRLEVPGGKMLNVKHNDKYYFASARPVCVYGEDPDNAKLIIFEEQDSQGKNEVVLGASADMGDEWNNKISSVYAVKGDWEVYDQGKYMGTRIVIQEGEKKNIATANNAATSIRPICATYKLTCPLRSITILDRFKRISPKLAGTKIIRGASGGSCSGTGAQTLNLPLSKSNPAKLLETNTIKIPSIVSGINWYGSEEVELVKAARLQGSGGTVEVKGGRVMTTSSYRNFSQEDKNLEEMSMEYQIPGAALLFRTIKSYTLQNQYAIAQLQLACPGQTALKNG